MTEPVQTGAMIALIPSEADAQRLAVEGGEPADQLHCTVLYLGDAVNITPEQVQSLHDWADGMGHGRGGWDSVDGEAFAAAIFNPAGDEPCAVLVLSGEELAEFYETALADVVSFIELPDDRHAPWIPHATLAYLNPLARGDRGVDVEMMGDAVARTGPIVFDRIRVAVGSEIYDVPIGPEASGHRSTVASEGEDEAAGGETPSVEAEGTGPELAPLTAASSSPSERYVQGDREAFDGCLRCFGPAHDGECPAAL
jgi:hypothetical protein